jgi:hypothetical protein
MATVLTATPRGLRFPLSGYAEIGLQCGSSWPNKLSRAGASLFGEESPYVLYHRAPRPLSVTESFALPPRPKAVNMSNTGKFSMREWLVPPILLPVFFALLVAAAVLIQR